MYMSLKTCCLAIHGPIWPIYKKKTGWCRNVVQIPTRDSVSVMGMYILSVFIWTSAGNLSSRQESTCCYCMILHSSEGTWNKEHLLYTGPHQSSSPCKQQKNQHCQWQLLEITCDMKHTITISILTVILCWFYEKTCFKSIRIYFN